MNAARGFTKKLQITRRYLGKGQTSLPQRRKEGQKSINAGEGEDYI